MGFAAEIAFTVLVLLLIIAGYWSLAVLPKQRAFKKHQQYIRRLRVGDRVVTYGGLIGTITGLDPDQGEATLQLAENLEVQIITAALIQPYDPEALARNAQIGGPGDGPQHREAQV